MMTRSKIALSIALVLGTVSAAAAATKHPAHHQRTVVERQVPAAAYQSFGFARGSARAHEPTYMYVQDEGYKNSLGE